MILDDSSEKSSVRVKPVPCRADLLFHDNPYSFPFFVLNFQHDKDCAFGGRIREGSRSERLADAD
jgi:hypothetical protein